ncbi:MAG: DNA polymerase III subunit beta [Candidatus Muiribacteriota bacterium]
MKFSIVKSKFYEALSCLKGVIPATSAMPVVQNFCLKCANNKLQLIGTDLENTIKLEIEAQTELEGELILPFKFLFDTVSNLPGDCVINCESRGEFVEIVTNQTKFKFASLKSDTFPKPPEFSEKNSIKLKTSVLKKLIKKTVFASSSDKTTRLHLAGLNIKLMQNNLHVAGTDVRRLAYIKYPMQSEAEFSFTVPSDTIKEVSNLCDKFDEVNLILTEQENQIVFSFENTVFYSKLLEDEFPDYLSIIPEGVDTRFKINTSKFSEILKMAKPVANAASIKSVILKISDNNFSVTASAEEQGNFETSINVEAEGDNAEISFNIDYLINVVDVIETDNIIVDFNGPTRPAVLREENNSNYIYIVMPLRG